jgi:hypothetical protein
MCRAFHVTAFIMALAACAPSPHAQTRTSEAAVDLAELWQDPGDLLQRDLLNGPGGGALAPREDQDFQFAAFKTSGTNPGYDVRDASGRLWSVKLGIEAQSEVTTSRILWAIGYHQPATYYLPEFELSGPGPIGGTKRQARFRTDVDPWRPGGDWSWYENPFVDTQPFRGLVVAQLILNAWDLKTPNNRIYGSIDSSIKPNRLFIVRDVGSSLGEARQFALFNALGTRGWQGSKNNVDDFERQRFITAVNGDDVEFDYRGVNQALVNTIKTRDVVWACELFARIPDDHWRAAFAAGHYSPADTERYIRKIKEKVAQGLALKRAPALTR